MKNKFSQRLKEILLLKNVSQNQLAKALKISMAGVNYWVNGKRQPSAENVYIVAEYFGVSSDYLLGLSDKM